MLPLFFVKVVAHLCGLVEVVETLNVAVWIDYWIHITHYKFSRLKGSLCAMPSRTCGHTSCCPTCRVHIQMPALQWCKLGVRSESGLQRSSSRVCLLHRLQLTSLFCPPNFKISRQSIVYTAYQGHRPALLQEASAPNNHQPYHNALHKAPYADRQLSRT